VLVVDDVAVKRAGKWALDGVSLRASAGEIVGIVGANGAGKSTLLAIVAGVLARDRGLVQIEGHLAGSLEAQRRLGYVPEAADPPGHLTADEIVALVGAVKGATLDADARSTLGLDDLAGRRIDRMSLGQRRRTCLAAALVGAPRLLVLDEPSNGLDAAGIDTLVALLTSRVASGAAALVASHDPELLTRLSARTIRLDRGRTQREP
jgi:ABC-2 type transport system ATP-binding protein